MKRRTLLRRIGATGIAATAIAAASTSAAAYDLECCKVCCRVPFDDDPSCPCFQCDNSLCTI